MKTFVGSMRFRVRVESVTNTRGADGAAAKSWTERCLCWCDIFPISSSESLDGSQVMGEATHAVRMRYNSEILLSDRIVYGARVFYIISIVDVNSRGRYLSLTVKESQA